MRVGRVITFMTIIIILASVAEKVEAFGNRMAAKTGRMGPKLTKT